MVFKWKNNRFILWKWNERPGLHWSNPVKNISFPNINIEASSKRYLGPSSRVLLMASISQGPSSSVVCRISRSSFPSSMIPRASVAPPMLPNLTAQLSSHRAMVVRRRNRVSGVRAMATDGEYSSRRSSSSEPRETILLPGCDYNHWLIVMEFPKDPAPTREQMIETYLNTLATVLGR